MSELVKRLREPITDLGRSYPGAALDLANDDRERAAQQLEAQTALIAELVDTAERVLKWAEYVAGDINGPDALEEIKSVGALKATLSKAKLATTAEKSV